MEENKPSLRPKPRPEPDGDGRWSGDWGRRPKWMEKSRWYLPSFLIEVMRIKVFYGDSENAVKTQIWIAISGYVFVPSSRSG
jgi:hypothetical protein